MATVVDALTVTLGLDASAFNAGQAQARASLKSTSDAATRTAKEMEAEGARAAQFFSQIKNEALSLVAVLLGGRGFEAFARDTTRSLADLGRQALNIGEAAPAVEAFAMAIERMGGNAASARGVLQNFSQAQADFVNFGKGNFGVDMALIGGNLDTTPLEAIQKFMAYIERERNKPGGIQRINAINREVFGLDESTMNALLQIGTVANLNREIQKSYELGTPTQEQIDRVTKMQTALIGLGQAAETAGRNLLSDLAPGLTAVSGGLSKLISEHPENAEVILGLVGALTALSAVRLSIKLMGLSDVVASLGALLALATRLTVFGGLAGLFTYLGFRIGGAGAGEDDEINRERAANGEPPLSPNTSTPTRDPAKAWLRNKVDAMPDGPLKRFLTEKFGTAAIADTSMSSEQQAFLKTLSDPESGGDYYVRNGGDELTDLSEFPTSPNPHGSSAAGRYQFMPDTWAEVSRALGLHDFSPASQDKAAWYLAEREYSRQTGRDLLTDWKSGGHEDDIAHALKGRWPSLPGGSQSRTSSSDFSQRRLRDLADPALRLTPPSGKSQLQSAIPSSTNITIGSINLPGVTDAKRFAADLPGALVNQANRGLA
jgi:muramidase (phage lysozyme)